jgi:hypothetical protein
MMLSTVAQVPGRVLSATASRLVVTFPGSADLDRQRVAVGANAVHLVFVIGSRLGPPEGAVLVHHDATLVGSVAFFAHNGHIGQGAIAFRLPLRSYGEAEITVDFRPVGYPGRPLAPQTLEVSATLDLVLSTVD